MLDWRPCLPLNSEFSQNRRGLKRLHQTNEDIYGKTVTVLWWINIYAFSRFFDLQSSNMYSWSIRWWKLLLVVQVYAGEMAHFCHLFHSGQVKSLNFSFSSVQLNLDYHISTAQCKSDWQDCSFSPEYFSILCLL